VQLHHALRQVERALESWRISNSIWISPQPLPRAEPNSARAAQCILSSGKAVDRDTDGRPTPYPADRLQARRSAPARRLRGMAVIEDDPFSPTAQPRRQWRDCPSLVPNNAPWLIDRERGFS